MHPLTKISRAVGAVAVEISRPEISCIEHAKFHRAGPFTTCENYVYTCKRNLLPSNARH